jgi:hypothetical protein
MRTAIRGLAIISLSCFLAAPAAQAALEVAAGKVNTSVGLTKANAKTATQQWQLETDPQMTTGPILPESDQTLGNYFPVSGVMDNTFDPTQYQLETDPSGNFALGYSVYGIDPFQVTSFKVVCLDTETGLNDGSYFEVDATTNPLVDTVTTFGDPNPNAETGQVDDITYSLISSAKGPNSPLPITQDQLFFGLNLIALEDTPNINPQLYSAFGGPNGTLTISDGGGNTNTVSGPDNFTTSYVPEPASGALLAVGALGLLKRRRSN